VHDCCCYVWGHDLLIIKLLLMKLHAQYMFICILCWFCSKWYKLVLLWLISDGFMFEWGCWWIRYVVVVNLYHGYSILWSCCLNWWSCAKMFMWRTKMNFWNMKWTWYNFCFHVVVVLVESFGRKRVFRVKCRCLSVFANKWLCEVWEKWFWDGWNLNFSVDYDRAKCQEPVGENGIEIRLTVWILCAKWWKRKNEEKAVLSIEHGRAVHGTGRANFLYLLARPCPCVARAVPCWQNFGFCVFCAFSPISALNWPLV
jgi:hypothetical protein